MLLETVSHLSRAFGTSSKGLVNELKFVGDALLTGDAVGLLEAACLHDPQHPRGEIHSIYFDTCARTYLAEKINGDNLKQKVRLRWYGQRGLSPGDNVTVFVEVKNRLGSARRKSRLALSAPYRWISQTPLDDPALSAFLYRHASLLSEPIPSHLVPVVCISYERRRYLCPQTGSRIALDNRIRAERFNTTQFAGVAGVQIDRAVCEFKNEGKALPEWSESLYSLGFRLRSFSKFGECMNQILIGGTYA